MVRKNADLSKRLLTRALELHEETIRRTGHSNYVSVAFAGEACLLLDFDVLLEKFRAILKRLEPNLWTQLLHGPLDPFLKGLVTIRKRTAILESYPELTDEYFANQPLEHQYDCDFEVAWNLASSQFDKEMVLLAQAVQGQIDKAVAVSVELESDRRWNVMVVATIEAFRRGDVTKANALYDSIPSETLSEWALPQLALGIAGYAAWRGYPYPDY